MAGSVTARNIGLRDRQIAYSSPTSRCGRFFTAALSTISPRREKHVQLYTINVHPSTDTGHRAEPFGSPMYERDQLSSEVPHRPSIHRFAYARMFSAGGK
jgi:hypothetical protein